MGNYVNALVIRPALPGRKRRAPPPKSPDEAR
jgi:hypothetical protein